MLNNGFKGRHLHLCQEIKQIEPSFQSTFPYPKTTPTRASLSCLCSIHPREVKRWHCTCNCRFFLTLERSSGGFPGSKNISWQEGDCAQPLAWQDAISWGLFTFIFFLFPLTLEFTEHFRLTYNLFLRSHIPEDLTVLRSTGELKGRKVSI